MTTSQDDQKKSKYNGTQVLDRIVRILHLVAASGSNGVKPADVHKTLGLTKSTAQRLLANMAQYQLLEHDPIARTYVLGAEIRLLSYAAPEISPDIRRIATRHVQKLAVECGDTVFLMVRSGYDTVCIDRHAGDYPVKAFIGEVGTRRPLGIGASGIILLAGMTNKQIVRMLDFLAPRHSEFQNTNRPVIEARIEEARRLGYAFSAGQVMKEVHAVGVPICDRMKRTIAALSIAGIRERISLSRRPELVSMLMSTKQEIETRFTNRD